MVNYIMTMENLPMKVNGTKINFMEEEKSITIVQNNY